MVVDDLLNKIRMKDAFLPDAKVVDYSGIKADFLIDPFDKVVYRESLNMPKSVIAIDLDDTILLSSYSCKELESLKALDSINYNQMTPSIMRFLKYAWRLPRKFQYDPEKYKFLKNPEVKVLVRPGILAALKGFKDAGSKLILVSMTAKKRMEFILSKLPILNDLFSFDGKLYVFAAEDILRSLMDVNKENPSNYTDSFKFHDKRPFSLAIKTPYLLKKLANVEYDIIIDNSDLMFNIFGKSKLGNKLVKIKPNLPYTSYTLNIVKESIEIISFEKINYQEVSFDINHELFNQEAYNYICFDDPFYYPLIHIKDQVDIYE